MNTATIVDGNILMYQVFNSAQGRLKTSTGVPSGLIYGFLRSLRSYEKRTGATDLYICKDVLAEGVGNAKAVAHPTYKTNRVWDEKKKAMYAQEDELYRIVGLTKYFVCQKPEYEADDAIAHLARLCTKDGAYDRVCFVSTDGDMDQIIAPNIVRFDPKGKRKADQFLGRDHILKKYGFTASGVLLWKAIMGDKSDNLAGAEQWLTVPKDVLISHISFGSPAVGKGEWQADYWLLPNRARAFLSRHNLMADKGIDIVEENLKIMNLYIEVGALDVSQGSSNKELLTQEFKRLEFKSLHIEEFLR